MIRNRRQVIGSTAKPLALMILFFLMPVCALVGTYVYAQSTAALKGRVLDSTGAVVPDVDITARNRATSLDRVARTDGGGDYQVAALPVGDYRIEVRRPGFQTCEETVNYIINGITLNNLTFSSITSLEFFDVFNHANFGRPGNVVGTPAFGRITSTRFPTGEAGSSRQTQFALKLIY